MARKSRKHKSIPAPVTVAGKIYRTGIYARLSGKGKTEETIEAQVTMITDYLEDKPQFQIVAIYKDDGFTGTNFDRPDFQRMMDAVRNGELDCIVVKDLSRFAREHIGAEDYLNNIFPFLGVRFIAILDGYDNIHLEPQEYFLASFKNIAHAYFAKETSRKVGDSLRIVQDKGLYIGSRAPFGYNLNPNKKHDLLINEEQAVIVREIFDRFISGETYTEICAYLNAKYPEGRHWENSAVSVIIHRELYVGTVVGHKTEQSMFHGIAWHKVPKEEQIRRDGGVPAIISREVWEKAQKIAAFRTQKRSMKSNPFAGFTFCELCGNEIRAVHDKTNDDYRFYCKNCKNRVYTSGSGLWMMAVQKMDLKWDITPEILQQKISKIMIRDRKHITFLDKEGNAI